MSQYKKIARIKLLDCVNCVVLDLMPEHVDLFHNKYALKAPKYFFDPRYQLGQWDGTIKFFHGNGRTYAYLLEEIIPMLQSLGYGFNLVDQRKMADWEIPQIDKDFFSNIEDPDTGDPLELRYYQVDAVNNLIGDGSGIVVIGTGGGKTMMNAALVETHVRAGCSRSITIVPREGLVKQTRREFIGFGLDTGEYSGSIKDIQHDHVISTWQALQNNQRMLSHFDVVVVDECHGLKGKVLSELLTEYGKHIQYRFGLTGTMPKEETDRMSVLTGIGADVVYEMPAHRLIEEGYLAKMDVTIYQLEENLEQEYEHFIQDQLPAGLKPPTYKQFKSAYFPDWESEKSHMQTYGPRIDWIATLIKIKREEKKGNIFCLVDRVNFGKKLEREIEGARFIYGKDKEKVRKDVYDMFQEHNDLVVIANVQIADTGLNIKRIFNLMFIDIGKSYIRVIQSIGRGLRKAKDKDSVKVTDICSDLKYSKKHLMDRMKFYRESMYPYKKHIVKYDE
jgi:superfamily II DNA or RNA helicase